MLLGSTEFFTQKFDRSEVNLCLFTQLDVDTVNGNDAVCNFEMAKYTYEMAKRDNLLKLLFLQQTVCPWL